MFTKTSPFSKKEWLILVLLSGAVGTALHKGTEHAGEYGWLSLMALMLLCGALANLVTKWQMPGVLGCLVVGFLLTNFMPALTANLKSSEFLARLGEFGILILLFDAGLHSSVHELLGAGAKSLRVAVVGVVLPLMGGFVLCRWFFPGASFVQAFFFGSTLTATSVGITMQVLGQLKLYDCPERQIILGAAVIDDVLGLMILAVNEKMGGSGSAVMAAIEVALTATVFFAAAAIFGDRMSHFVARNFARIDNSEGSKVMFLLFWMVLGALAAHLLHLEPILGGFAAGWVISDPHVSYFQNRFESSLESLLYPVSVWTISFFFIFVGMEVKLTGLGPEVLGVTVATGVMAIVTKWVAGFAVLDRSLNRRLIGHGMIPRGEVGIVFANKGFARTGLAGIILTQTMFTTLILVIAISTVAAIGLLSMEGRQRQQA